MTALADLFGFKTKKEPQQPTPPPAPSPIDADAKAKEDQKRRQLISQRTGGKTILSSETGIAGTKSLLGE